MLVVAATALAACFAGLGNQFTSDDVPLIQNNAQIHDLQWVEIFASPYWPRPFSQDLYRPIASLITALQHAAGAGTPMIFRVVSCALYAGACIAVFRLASRLVRPEVSLGVALLFAVTPLHVEPVALATGQSEIIVALIATVMMIRYVDARRRGSLTLRDWLILGLLYVVAALSKENGLVLPALLVATEACLFGAETRKGAMRALVSGFAALAVVGALVIAIRTLVLRGNVVGSFTAETLVGLSIGNRALTMLAIVPEWARLLAWPAHLRIDYSPAEFVASHSFGWHEALGAIIVAAVAAAIWFARKRAPVVSLGLLWCAIGLLPVSNVLIPTGVLLAERTLLLPSVGVALTLGGIVEYALTLRPASQSLIKGLALACGIVVVAGLVRSAMRQRVWHDAHSLSIASVADAPRSWRVQRSFGETMFDLGRTDEGLAAYQRAIKVAPEPWFVRNDLSRRLRERGDDSTALVELRQSLAEQPGQRGATVETIVTLLALGRYAEARQMADSVIGVAAAPPIMLILRHVADSAFKINAPPGTVRLRMQAR